MPTQTIVSLEQEHPEGHLKFLLDSAAPQIYRSANPASSHCLVRAMLIPAHQCGSLKAVVRAGSGFSPPGRHQTAALYWKPLTQADTAAAASRKAASDGGGAKSETQQ